AQGLLESLRQGIAARFFRFDGLLEDCFAAGGFLRENPLGFAQLGVVAPLPLAMRDHTAEVEVHDERRLAAWARDLDFRLQARHHRFPPNAPARPLPANSFLISIGEPSGSFAVSRKS